MTKKQTKKTTVAKKETADTCTCGCGGECSCCKCGPAKVALLGVSALALVLSICALVKKPCDKALTEWVNNNPKVIADSVEKYYRELDAKQRAAEKAQPKVAPADMVAKILNDKSNYSLGNPKGKFVIDLNGHTVQNSTNNLTVFKISGTNVVMKDSHVRSNAPSVRSYGAGAVSLKALMTRSLLMRMRLVSW